MKTKTFLLLLLSVAILGGSLGGAFAGGLALGKSQKDEMAPGGTMAGQSSLRLDPEVLSQFSPEQLDQFRQRLQNRSGQGNLRGAAARAGITGTINNIEGSSLTIDTTDGTLKATVGTGTTIQMFTSGALADLESGKRVAVAGERGEDGSIVINSLIVIPDDGVSFSGGLFPMDRQRRSQDSP